MSNIYVLNGNANSNFDADHADVILTDADFVLVECSFNKASELAHEWGLDAPMLARDGVWISESGDETYIADGEIVDDISKVADALGYDDEDGLDVEDFIRIKNRVF